VTVPKNVRLAMALICVAVTSGFVMIVGWRLITILAAPDWCARALGAGGLTGKGQTITGLNACVDLLKVQLRSLALNSHIVLGVLALCLAVLVVIVLAEGRLTFRAGKEGVEGNITEAADRVADAAVEKAD
jgi:hypothetical protein